MKAASQLLSQELLAKVVAKSRINKMRAQKARETKRRRYEETSEWVHPLGDLFHGVDRNCL